MLTTVHGVVVHTADMPGGHRLIGLFTRENGMMSAYVPVRRSPRVSFTAASQLFCYAEFVLYSKGDHYWVREIDLLEPFLSLRDSIERVALATYLCDVVRETATNEPDVAQFRLLLNALFALSTAQYDPRLVKATFEFRTAAVLGFAPDVSGCGQCGEDAADLALHVMGGSCLCAKCRMLAEDEQPLPEGADEVREAGILLLFTPRAMAALRFCLTCPLERILSFKLEGADLDCFARGGEVYLLNHVERSFASLEFYKSLT